MTRNGLTLSHNAATVVSDVVVVRLLPGGNLVRYLVRATFASRHLDDQNRLLVDLLDIQPRLIVRLHQVVESHHVFLDRLNLIGVDADDGTDRPTIYLLHTHHDITTTRLVEVVGESTHATVDGIRIPSRLILNAVTLYSPSTEQFFYINVSSTNLE